MHRSSEGPQTVRQISKCSLEAPGGTSDDFSIVSLSENLEEYVNMIIVKQDESIISLDDVIIEEKTNEDK